MSWNDEVAELERRLGLIHEMGGPDSVAFHHGRGKLTVRERIDRLQDPDTFREIGALAGTPTWNDDGSLAALTPANYVIGTAELDRRRVVLCGGDFTIRGGAADGSIGNKYILAEKLARDHRLPLVRLLDATGGSVKTFEKLGHTYLPDNDSPDLSTELLSQVPVVATVLGSVAGLPAVQGCLCHFNVMVRGTSQIFVAGPAVVREGVGVDITKEDLGDERVQIPNGVIDNLAEDEDGAFAQTRRFLSYLPSSVWELPPRIETDDPVDRCDDYLLEAIPKRKRRIYDPYRILGAVLDRDSFFEIAPLSGQAHITGLGRVDGYPVGVMINNPRHYGGAMGPIEAEKAMRLVQLCDTFHLPLVWLCDEPGFHVGPANEVRGILRGGARAVTVFASSRMPYISFIIRQCYGVAGGLHVRHSGMYQRYAWPSAHTGSMHIEGGTMVAYRREIENADDPRAKREEIEARLEAIASPFRNAHAMDIENLIDPRQTRPLLAEFVRSAQAVLATQLGPTPGPSYRP
ncbi:MAG: acyl-CoA carboxylase subunit beta [Acidimicrobiales bacterium]